MPAAAELMEQEINSGAFDNEVAHPETLRVYDHGADTTIFSFSSAGLLHAGLPTFAFLDLFGQLDRSYNLVFLRDVYRTAYHLTPDRKPGGLAHYEERIRETMAQLGASRNLAIGESSGAAAALYFGTRCGMDKVVAFGVPYPIQIWTSPLAVLRALFNLPELIRDPSGYWQTLLITLFSVIAHGTLRRHVGEAGIFDPVETFLQAEHRPQVKLFYGERCYPDARIAGMLQEAPEVRCHGFETGRHILWIPIARSGSMAELIKRELETPDSGP